MRTDNGPDGGQDGWTVDVLVVGGGTAGVTAALAAASHGSRVMIADRDSALGGVGTRSGIHVYYRGSGGGIQNEIDRRTRVLAKELGSRAAGFHPELKREVVAAMLAEAGVRVLCRATAADVLLAGDTLVGVVLETPERRIEVRAAVTVDATGDGDICRLAGVPVSLGREWDGLLHSYSIAPRFLDTAKGELSFANFDAGWVDPTDSWDVSDAYRYGRRLIWDIFAPLQQHEPYPRPRELISVAPMIGFREGPYVQGEYTLTLEDLILDRRFPDVVLRCLSHYDTHAADMASENEAGRIWSDVMGMWLQPLGGDVPYRCLVPVKIDGLLVGCRALSQTRDAGMALRMQRDMQKVGEAAGTAAALCCREQCEPRHLPVRRLQELLIERGVLAEDDLTRESRPWVALGEDGRRGDWTPERARSAEGLPLLVEQLGTEHEGKALWWLRQAGEAAVAPLLERLADPSLTDSRRRGAALALALLGSDAGASLLVASIARHDGEKLPDTGKKTLRGGTFERWIASLAALTALRHAGAAAVVVERLREEDMLPGLLYMLHYLIAVADRLPGPLADQAAAEVEALLARSDLETSQPSGQSYLWSVELTAACLLVLLGKDAGWGIIEAGRRHRRGFVRTAANMIADRLKRRWGHERLGADARGGGGRT